MHDAAPPVKRIDPDRPVVALNDLARDGQAESRSAPARRVKNFKHSLAFLGWNARAGVADFDAAFRSGDVAADFDPPVVASLDRLNRVEKDVPEDLAQRGRVRQCNA